MAEKMSSKEIAQRGWEWQNNVRSVDDLFRFNEEEHQRMMTARPWEKDVNFFRNCRISALALLKMVIHARSGGNLEVMGLMLGRADAGSMIVMDAFALPVEGTETRVNAQAQAYEYSTQYMDVIKQVGRMENVIGWYHSHPGYGCWLSGIDVETQRLNQQFQEPWLAVVIDPIRTIAAGQVDLGAFRTYPKGYIPAQEKDSEHRSIPLKKVEDFGTHYKEYYQLAVSYFKTSTDKKLLNQLWNQYWVATLSSSPWFKNLDYNIEQTQDVAAKLSQGVKNMKRESFMFRQGLELSDSETKFHNAVEDGKKICCEAMHAVMSQIIKRSIFNDCESIGAIQETEMVGAEGVDVHAGGDAVVVDVEDSAAAGAAADEKPSSTGSAIAPLADEEQMHID